MCIGVIFRVGSKHAIVSTDTLEFKRLVLPAALCRLAAVPDIVEYSANFNNALGTMLPQLSDASRRNKK